MRAQPRKRGFALLLALWTLALLSLLLAGFAGRARTEVQVARNLSVAAKAERLAEAGIALAALRLLANDPAEAWAPDGSGHTLALPGGTVRVTLQDEGGKLDLNAAPPALLEGLLRELGLDLARRRAVLDGLAAWKRERQAAFVQAAGARLLDAPPPAGPSFLAVEELRGVPGVDEGTYRALRPYVTVQTGLPTLDPWTAPEPLLRAVPGLRPDLVPVLLDRRRRGTGTLPDGLPDTLVEGSAAVTAIRAEATLPDGTTFTREALVTPGESAGQPYRVLAWRRG